MQLLLFNSDNLHKEDIDYLRPLSRHFHSTCSSVTWKMHSRQSIRRVGFSYRSISYTVPSTHFLSSSRNEQAIFHFLRWYPTPRLNNPLEHIRRPSGRCKGETQYFGIQPMSGAIWYLEREGGPIEECLLCMRKPK